VAKRAINYSEGELIGVPLLDRGFARGVIARMIKGGGCLFGYFFGPRLTTVHEVTAAPVPLLAENAILVTMFGDAYLVNERWPRFGPIRPWRRDDWPLPPLARDTDDGAAFLSIYDDTLRFVSEKRICPEDCSLYPEDVLIGAGNLERRLTDLLD